MRVKIPNDLDPVIPTAGSLSEPGIRACPHTCPHSFQGCDREDVFGRSGNSCRRHARNHRQHEDCDASCPAHESHEERVLDRELTRSEWLSIDLESRDFLKIRHGANSPTSEVASVASDEATEIVEYEVSVHVLFVLLT